MSHGLRSHIRHDLASAGKRGEKAHYKSWRTMNRKRTHKQNKKASISSSSSHQMC